MVNLTSVSGIFFVPGAMPQVLRGIVPLGSPIQTQRIHGSRRSYYVHGFLCQIRQGFRRRTMIEYYWTDRLSLTQRN